VNEVCLTPCCLDRAPAACNGRRMTDEIRRGDFYEDWDFRPMLCFRADYSAEGDDLLGISLVGPGNRLL
jgi:hypothetical protein